MALFQSKPQAGGSGSLFSYGLNKTVLLVGLGNPGSEYDDTRHNAGYICIDAFVDSTSEMEGWISKKDLKCHMSIGQIGGTRVIAIKPQKFMNLSGESVQAVAAFYKISPDKITVIHDELDVNFGQIRIRMGGGIGENYGRIRVGIGPKKPEQIKSEDFVLQSFSKEESLQLSNMTKEVTAIITEQLFSDGLRSETRDFLVS
jgi:PTH1 family peptidyl-tRNA hydrolase